MNVTLDNALTSYHNMYTALPVFHNWKFTASKNIIIQTNIVTITVKRVHGHNTAHSLPLAQAMKHYDLVWGRLVARDDSLKCLNAVIIKEI